MRIVHVSPTDTDGGAAKGAYRLHTALREHGIDSRMLVQRKYSDDPSVTTFRHSYSAIVDGLRDRFDRVPLRFYDWDRTNWWTVGWLPFEGSQAIRDLQPDVVQFHWTGRGAAPIRTIANLRDIPVVWTLRDMWPLTGGCHYSSGCERYLTGCGQCPQLGSKSQLDISWWQWRRKHRAWKDVKISYVALSNWMAERIRQSPLSHGNEISVIPNGIDVDRYAPTDRMTARAAWRLPTDRKIILFGAIKAATDPRKGFRYLAEALETLAQQGWRDHADLVIFGQQSGPSPAGFRTHYVGTLRDEISLALLYACADVMVVPSIEDNLPKTPLEAMACGTPVAAFANTGPLDIVDHQVNGYLAENLSSDDLARGIAWCLEEGARDHGFSLRAREKVLRCFDIRSVVLRHVELYCRLLGHRVPTPVTARTGADAGPVADARPMTFLMEGSLGSGRQGGSV